MADRPAGGVAHLASRTDQLHRVAFGSKDAAERFVDGMPGEWEILPTAGPGVTPMTGLAPGETAETIREGGSK